MRPRLSSTLPFLALIEGVSPARRGPGPLPWALHRRNAPAPSKKSFTTRAQALGLTASSHYHRARQRRDGWRVGRRLRLRMEF